MIYKIASKLNIKRGNPYAESIAEQSYLYRLGYVWINVMMTTDKRGTTLNPLRMSIHDIAWIAYFFVVAVVYCLFMVGFAPWKALSLGEVRPVKFWDDEKPSTGYQYSKRWYFDNGKIRA